MARAGITEQQVIEAAEGLTASGQAVTVSAVREALGGTGSYSTINPLLAKWRETSGGARPGSDVPDMPEPVGRAARAFWGAAWKEAQTGIQGERETLEAARRDMTRERQDMTAEILRLEGENTRQADDLERLHAAMTEADTARRGAEDSANALRVENARLDERAKAAEAHGAGLQGELDKLHARFQEIAAKVTAPASRSHKKPDESPTP